MVDLHARLKKARKKESELLKAYRAAERETLQAEKDFLRAAAAPYLAAVKDFNSSTDEFYIWKKAYYYPTLDSFREECIVKLRVTTKSKRILEFTRSCSQSVCPKNLCSEMNSSKLRVSEAIVESIQTIDGKPVKLPPYGKVFSGRDRGFTYTVGSIVRPQYKFDTNINSNCTSGIYGFLSRKYAERY